MGMPRRWHGSCLWERIGEENMRQTPKAILIFKRVYVTAVLLTAVCWLLANPASTTPADLAAHAAGAIRLGR
jgi:hypothetical protein